MLVVRHILFFIKNYCKNTLLLAFILPLSVVFFQTQAATYYFVTNNGNWNSAANWKLTSCASATAGAVPGAGDDVIICDGITVNIAAGGYTPQCNNMYLRGGTISFSNNKTITVNGNLYVENNATSSVVVAGGGANPNRKINVLGTCNIDAGSTLSFAGASWEQGGITTINGNLTFTVGNSGNKLFKANINIGATGVFNNAIGETPTINGNITNNGSWIGCTGGTCTYTMGSVAGTYSISGNAVAMSILSLGNAATVINNSGILVLDGSAGPVLTGSGTFNNLATGILYLSCTGTNVSGITFNASTVGNVVHYEFAGNQTMAVPNDGGYSYLVCATSGTKTMAGNFTVSDLLTIKDAAIVNVAANTLNGAGGLTMTGTSDLQIAKLTTVPELSGTYSLSSGTVTLNGAGIQQLNTIPVGASSYNNLLFSNSGSKNINGLLDITGNVTVSGTATLTNNSSFDQVCNRTFTYSSTGSTTLTAATNITIGNFSQTAGTFIDNGVNITVCGTSWDRTGGTFTANGRLIVDGSVTVTGASATTFHNITINNGATLISHATNMGVKGTEFTNNGTFNANNGLVTFSGTTGLFGTSTTTFNNITINTTNSLTGHATEFIVQGNWISTGATFNPNNGTVHFTGSNTQTLTKTGGTENFYNLSINKTAGTSLTSAATTITVTNELTLTEGIFNISTNTLNGAGQLIMIGGDLQMAKLGTAIPELTGNYSITGGTVTLNGAGNQTLNTTPVGADTYHHLVLGNSGSKDITGLLTINGDVTLSGSASISGNSAFTQDCSRTFTYNSSGTTTLTAATPVTVGNYSQTGSGTFNINGNNFTVCGIHWNKSNGTFTTSGTVVFNSVSAQLFSETASTTFNNITINNSNGITLSTGNLTLNNILTFTQGNIITGSNTVILALTGASVSRTSGHVVGNLRKAIPAGVSSKSFEIGTGSDYAPIDFTFNAGTTTGNLTCTTTGSDNPFIFSSELNPSKTVNRYWRVTNNSIATINYGAVFHYPASEVDPSAIPANFLVYRYNGTSWNTTNIGSITATSTEIINASYPSSGSYDEFQIGEIFNTTLLYNRVTGSANWSNASTWIQERTGSITTSTASTTVTGLGTLFCGVDGICGNADDEVQVGDPIMSQTSPGTVIGNVASLTNNTSLTLSANATVNETNTSYGRQKVPTADDHVFIGNPNLGASVTIVLDVAASVNKVTFTSMGFGNTLDHNVGMHLDVATLLTINQPSSNALTNAWNINAGTANILGNLVLASNNATTTRVATTVLTTGTLTIGNNIVFNSEASAPGTAVLNLSGGAGQVNLAGLLVLNNGSGTITPGTTSTFNFNSTAINQVINLSSNLTYSNVSLNNTFTNGVSPSAAINTTNVNGNIRVASGTFDNGGFSITGNGSKTFQLDNSAVFKLTGTAGFPTGFGTYTFGVTSLTYYQQTNNQNIRAITYGDLFIQPQANSITHTFEAGTTRIQGMLTCGNGSFTGIIVTANTNSSTIDIDGTLYIHSGATYSAHASNAFTVGGNFTNNGGTFTHNNGTITFDGSVDQQISNTSASFSIHNVTVSKTLGTNLSTGGSITTLYVNNYTNTSGNFTAPPTLNITGNVVLTAGTFTAGANITHSGNWTNNGGTFTHNNGTITFNGAGTQTINGTAASQTFYNVVLQKTAGQLLNTGGSTTNVTFNAFTMTTGNFTAPATMTIQGNLLISSGTYTAGANSNWGGNITYNGGTLTLGANTVTLNGTSKQTISGITSFPAFNNLTVNNSNPSQAIELSAPISVSGVFTLTDGHVLTSSTNSLTLAASASIVLNAPVTQDSSFVKGPLNHTIATTSSTTKVFPIGATNIMKKAQLTVTQVAATSTIYTAQYFKSSPSVLGWTLPGDFDKVTNVGYYEINKGAGSGVASASVTLDYFAEDEVNDPVNLAVAKGNPNAWTNIGGVGNTFPSGSITSSVNFTTFSFFALANRSGGSNPLPISLLQFKGSKKENDVLLDWLTAAEINNEYFEIERSIDNTNFSNIGKVNSNKINSNMLEKYSFTDTDPLKGENYYRLKQVDVDGKFTYSKSIMVYFEDISSAKHNNFFTIYPNPTSKDNINIKAESTYMPYEEVYIYMVDIHGKEFFSNVLVTDENGSFLQAIDVDKNIKPGIYLIISSTEAEYISKPIIIQ